MKDNNRLKYLAMPKSGEMDICLRQGRSKEPDSSDRPLTDIIIEKDLQLSAIIEALDGLVYICSPDYKVEFMNVRLIERTGYDGTGKRCYKVLHDRKTKCPWCVNEKVSRGQTVRWEVKSPKDGKWYYVVNTPLYRGNGSISKFSIIVDINSRKLEEEELLKHREHLEDIVEERTSELMRANELLKKEIDERKQVEKALRENQKRHSIIFEGSRDAIFISRADGRLYKVNNAATKLTGHSREELENLSLFDLHEAIDLKEYSKYFKRIWAGQSIAGKARITRKNGATVHTEYSSRKIIIDGMAYVHTIARDISEQITYEKALKLSESKYRELVQNTNSIIIRFDTQGRITFFNEYAQRFFGFSEKEIVGLNILGTIVPWTGSTGRDYRSMTIDFLQNSENYKTYETENIKSNGERVWIAWTNKKVVDAAGGKNEILSVGIDVTERKRARHHIHFLTHQLIKAQENERLKLSRDLHDNVAQDLSTLKISLETLFADQKPDIQKHVKSLSRILRRSIASVRNMAYDLRPPGLDQLGLVTTIFLFCEDFMESTGIDIDFGAAGMDELDLDYDTQINIYRLIQEAFNNIKNHSKATIATIRFVASSPNIVIRIKDNGKGFDVQKRRRQALEDKRMGLQSMKERVALLEGKMNIQSRKGKGSYILIEIPMKEKAIGRQKINFDH